MLMLAGMPFFDAMTHAMTTLATGGYSTRTASVGAFDSQLIELIVICGMIVGSLPFVHYLALTRGGWKSLIEDPQVKWFLALTIIIVSLISVTLYQDGYSVAGASGWPRSIPSRLLPAQAMALPILRYGAGRRPQFC